jgi:hypothetical protein
MSIKEVTAVDSKVVELSRKCEFCGSRIQITYNVAAGGKASNVIHKEALDAARIQASRNLQSKIASTYNWFSNNQFAQSNYGVFCTSCNHFSSAAMSSNFNGNLRLYLNKKYYCKEPKPVKNAIIVIADITLSMIFIYVLYAVSKNTSWSLAWTLNFLFVPTIWLASCFLLSPGGKEYERSKVILSLIEKMSDQQIMELFRKACLSAGNRINLDSFESSGISRRKPFNDFLEDEVNLLFRSTEDIPGMVYVIKTPQNYFYPRGWEGSGGPVEIYDSEEFAQYIREQIREKYKTGGMFAETELSEFSRMEIERICLDQQWEFKYAKSRKKKRV